MTTVADDTAADSPDEPGPDAEQAGRTPRPRKPRLPAGRLRPLLRGAAVVGAAVFIAGSGYQSWLLWQQHRTDTAAREALEIAQHYAVTLTTADTATVDSQITALIDGSTGDFHDRYAKSSSDLRRMLIANKVTTRGTVLDSAVKSADPHTVTVLLFVNQTFSAPVLADRPTVPPADLTGMTITVQKVDGRWLVSEVVAAEPRG